MIAKKDLVHGGYYLGSCRNATIARWHDTKQCFFHWRHKFGQAFVETISHPDDEKRFDVFTPERLAWFDEIKEEIPFGYEHQRGLLG